jgi:hypothetical protein
MIWYIFRGQVVVVEDLTRLRLRPTRCKEEGSGRA